MLNKPHIITIKVFATGTLPTNDQLEALFGHQTDFNLALLAVETMPMKFDGNGLVPIKSPPPPKEEPAAEPKKSSPAPKVAAPKKVIHFEPGSDAEKIWLLLRDGAALTSTQVREKLGLASGIVNTTIYRLKGAGMIRPMSYNAPNGDTLYTTTHLDAKE